MNVPDQSVSIWRDQFILSSSDQPASIKDIRPTAEDHGALDPKTYDAIEADALFEVIDHTQTAM